MNSIAAIQVILYTRTPNNSLSALLSVFEGVIKAFWHGGGFDPLPLFCLSVCECGAASALIAPANYYIVLLLYIIPSALLARFCASHYFNGGVCCNLRAPCY